MNNVEEKCGDVAAHVLIFPSPAQGHVNSMLKLAELLALYDVHVTFLNTDYIHQRLMRFGDIEALLACYSTLQFKTISDCFTEDQHPGFGDWIGDVIDSINLHAKPLLRDILVSENPGKPRVTCIIADGIFGSLTTDLAGEVGIPCIHFRTISACCFWAYLCVPKLFHCKELPIRDLFSLTSKLETSSLFRPLLSLYPHGHQPYLLPLFLRYLPRTPPPPTPTLRSLQAQARDPSQHCTLSRTRVQL